ncbi:hypothetical protein J6Q66_08380 [bacterium]|nr:hypothetical protein [bacterium]
MKVALNTHKPVSFGECAIRYGQVYLVKNGKYHLLSSVTDQLQKLEPKEQVEHKALKSELLKSRINKLSEIFYSFKR